MDLAVETMIVGAFATNCYLVGCPVTKQAVVIDPGAEPEYIAARAHDLGLNVIAVINTHGHIDHVMGNDGLCDATGAPLEMHPDDVFFLRDLQLPALFGMPQGRLSRDPSALLHEGDVVPFGQRELRVLHTPGHSPGSISLVTDDGRVFVGDTLFRYGVGRTDLAGGDFATLLRSINEKLLTLGDDTRVLPGHGPATTIGDERRSNPFLGQRRPPGSMKYEV